ncbi:bacteriorhodopsin [Pontimonas sp.]|uniref:bacteriorhodopsin n=1 Tax=Pontimonas sp. TaxID=2304492 RepID=UPI0028709F4C|nr:bacteriorhodopsin [Pontimonas sp.]MDR9396035.1 bacteriorhodopsin [Pontimonas sp.]
MDLLAITQAFFMLGFVAMAAGTLYFVLERNDIKPEHRMTATYAGIITFIAAIMYWIMTDFVGFFDQAATADVAATMPYRYIDWLLTTPLLLVEFGLIVAIAGGATKGFVTRIVIADVIMIVTGYLGELGEAGTVNNWVFFIISSLAWLYIVYAVYQVKLDGMPDYAARAVRIMRRFVFFGWTIYPVGVAVEEFLTLGGADLGLAVGLAAIIFVIADVLNKVGFGMVAVSAAKKASETAGAKA